MSSHVGMTSKLNFSPTRSIFFHLGNFSVLLPSTGKAMLGIAFQLDFVTSFCREYGAWIWPKNGTRTAELVQKRQQRSCWPAGEYASVLDESFPFFWPRPVHLFQTPNTTALCARFVHLKSAVLRRICYPCSWCNDIGSRW